MPLPSAEPLFAHLVALRDADDPADPRHAARWRDVSAWLAAAFPSPDAEDARQETLVSLVRNVHRMHAEAPLQAAKWVSTIHRRKRIDGLRARAHDPVHQGMQNQPRDPTMPGPLDRLEAVDAPTLTSEMLQSLVTTVLDHVHRALEETTASAPKRLLRRTQAQAALLRLVCGWDADAIAQVLDLGEPIGKDRLYKWIERGREPVQMGLARWSSQCGDEDEDEGARTRLIIDVIAQAMDERRADAGRPRLHRRKNGAEDGP